MDLASLIGVVLGGLLYLLLTAYLLELTQAEEDKKKQFYLLSAIPLLLLLFLPFKNTLTYWLQIGLIIIYWGLWAMTLWELGGEEEEIWFYIIAFINPLFIIYRLIESRGGEAGRNISIAMGGILVLSFIIGINMFGGI